MEIDKLIEGADIVRFIKAQKSNDWAIYKEYMENMKKHGDILYLSFRASQVYNI